MINKIRKFSREFQWRVIRNMDRRMMRGIGRNQKPSRNKKFIYDLPHKEYKDIEDMLNMNDIWENLAGEHLQLRVGEIDKMRRFNQIQGTKNEPKLILIDFNNHAYLPMIDHVSSIMCSIRKNLK